MALIGQIVVRMGADARPLIGGLRDGESAVSRFSQRVASRGGIANALGGGAGAGAIGATMALASTGIGAAVALASKASGAILGAITNASDLNETLSKTSVIFGPAADAIIGKAGQMANQFGTDRSEYINAATSFGAVFKGMGKSQEEAAGLGNQLALLGMDMASFDNASNSEVFTSLQAALRGEFDPLERFRVFLSAAKIEDQALRMGLAATKGELTDSAKKTATLALIMAQTKDAQGDLARTAGGAANQFRQAGGGLANFATSIGQLLLPAVQTGTGIFNEFLGSILSAFEDNRGMFEGWASALTGAMEGVGFVVRNFGDIWDLVQIGIAEKIINVGEYLAVIPTNLALIAEYIGNNWLALVKDAFVAYGTYILNASQNTANLFTAIQGFFAGEGFNFEWTPLLDGFKATAEQLPELIRPELTTLSDDRDAVMGRIAAREAKRAEDMVAKSGAGPTDAGPAAVAEEMAKKAEKGNEYRATAAVEFGSKEFNSAITRHYNGASGTDDKPIKTVAKNSADHLVEARTQTATLKSIADKMGGQLAAATL